MKDFKFIEKKEALNKQYIAIEKNRYPSYWCYVFYNPETNIVRKMSYTDKDDMELYDYPFDLWVALWYEKIKYHPNENDKVFHIHNLCERDLKIFDYRIKQYGIGHYRLDKIEEPKKNSSVAPYSINLTFLEDSEVAAFMFYFHDFIINR